MRSQKLILFPFFLSFLFGCAGIGSFNQAMFEPASATTDAMNASAVAQADNGQVEGYQIGPEDTLNISVWREESLQREVLVRPDGMISFPLAGDVMAAGRTAEQVAQEIKERL